MSDPGNFTSFSDYLGLNQEAGASMRQAANDSYKGPREQQLGDLEQQHVKAAGAAGWGAPGSLANSQALGESVRTGMASYGEFLKGMADPAARQALMEKTYGKGAVSAMDSALTGNGGGMTAANSQINRMQTGAESADINAQRAYQTNKASEAVGERNTASAVANAKLAKQQRDAAISKSAEDSRERKINAWMQMKSGGQKWDANNFHQYGQGGIIGGSWDPTDMNKTPEERRKVAYDTTEGWMKQDEQARGKTFGVNESGEDYWK